MEVLEAIEVEIITEFLEETKQYLIDYLDLNDRNATGKTKKAIQVKDVSASGGKLVGPEHVEFTFKGRKPGKMPPLSNIIDWCVARGIPRSRAWVIANKIKREGTKLYKAGGSNTIESATSKEKIDEFKRKLTDSILTSLKTDLSIAINK